VCCCCVYVLVLVEYPKKPNESRYDDFFLLLFGYGDSDLSLQHSRTNPSCVGQQNPVNPPHWGWASQEEEGSLSSSVLVLVGAVGLALLLVLLDVLVEVGDKAGVVETTLSPWCCEKSWVNKKAVPLKIPRAMTMGMPINKYLCDRSFHVKGLSCKNRKLSSVNALLSWSALPLLTAPYVGVALLIVFML